MLSLVVQSSLSGDERTNVLRVTSHAEHVFSLLAELAQEYTSGIDRQREAERCGPESAGSRTGPAAADGALRSTVRAPATPPAG